MDISELRYLWTLYISDIPISDMSIYSYGHIGNVYIENLIYPGPKSISDMSIFTAIKWTYQKRTYRIWI